ncbi:CPBP family intramembrane metalloprotease [Puniceicoccaceae bacterium K14]|nr:CPBP family intramembrane metalloprotease [Puniceicoccaceae bacterium K14]
MLTPESSSTTSPFTSQRLGPWKIKGVDFVLFLSISFISIYLLSSITLKIYSGESELLPSILSGYGLQFGAILGFLAFSHLQQAPKTSRPCKPLEAIANGAVGMLLCYACLLLVAPLWKGLLDALQITYEPQDPVKMLMEGGTRLEMGLMYALIVVAAPIGEELLFRAGIFRFLNGKMPLYASVGISSIAFAAVHFNTYSFGPLFVLGAAMCLVYRKTGNILSSITLHCLFNLTNLIFISFAQTLPQ